MNKDLLKNLAELGGLFLVAVGVGLCVAAASLVSLALALLVAGIFALFLGITIVYVANAVSDVKPRATQ